MPQKLIDQTTIQPDGRPGDDAYTAFATCNENFLDAEGRLTALGSRIDQEATDRGQHVAAESAIREAADAALSQQIAAVASRIPGKNIVINGDFRFWQRGTSFLGLSSARYTADRFIPVMVDGVVDCARAEHPPGDPSNLFNARYFMRCTVGQTASSGSLATLQYRIENGHRLLSGKTVTVSMLVRASSATRLGMEFEMVFGTGGAPSPAVYGNSQLVTGITGGWQRISKTFTIGSVEGKAFGTTTDGYLALILWMDAGSDWNARSAGVGRQHGDFQFSNIQIEVGSVATDFEQRPDALELVLCQRYFRKSFPLAETPANNSLTCIHRAAVSFATTAMRVGIAFDSPMRATPALTLFMGAEVSNGTAGRWGYYDTAAGAWKSAGNSVSVVQNVSSGFTLDIEGTGLAYPNAYIVTGQYTADAEL